MKSVQKIHSAIFSSEFVGADQDDLWDLAKTTVPSLLINGNRMLDFARPLPLHIAFSGELGIRKGKKVVMEKWLEEIIEKPSDGLIVFSLGTVSNTTNMPAQMIVSP